jgi:predicted aminopeptidase
MVLKFASRLRVRRAARTLLIVSAACMLSGCYVLQAARGQLTVMQKRQPIERLISRPDTGDSLKQQLVKARRIRDFASQSLGLPDNASYRSYADIGRPYVVWNVVATPEFSVRPRQWCFPVAGCVAYRGYFSEAAARRFAAQRQRRGDDVVLGGVPAYSTLGRIADPLLNTVSGYPELDLAALVFHELAHQVAYTARDSSYNEAFATAVEEEGVARYAATWLSPAVLAAWQQRRQLRIAVTGLMAAARDDLARLYGAPAEVETKRAGKAARLQQLGNDIRALEQRTGRSSGYGSWIAAGLNNAHLASVATYYAQVPHFEALLREQCGNYLPCLYVKVKREVQQHSAVPAPLP